MSAEPSPSTSSISEISRLFLRLGFTAFGGPAAHIAMFREEAVERRKWLTDEEFLDMLGVTNLIPGPNSTEMAIHLGYKRGGWRGLIAAGLCFVLPAVGIVLVLAWLYVEYGTTPTAESMLYGIKPIIIAVILKALWGLANKAVKSRLLAVAGSAAAGLYLLGIHELVLLFGIGLLVMLIHNRDRLKTRIPLLLMALPSGMIGGAALEGKTPFSYSQLFLIFLKIGSVLYGSGYVLLAFLRGDLVERLGWLTEQQLLDAVAIGQFTPGPLFTTATFIGYIMGGFLGAVIATAGIFLPSFVFVGLIHRLVPFLRGSVWFSALLDGVNVAALGLMAGVTYQLGVAAIIDVFTVIMTALSAVLIFRFQINTTWLVIGGGILGIIYHAL